MRIPTIFLLSLVCFSACTFSSDVPPDTSTFQNHRKQVWFVDHKSNEGRWIWIENEAGPVLKNGSCTMYYADQTPRMSFELDNNGDTHLIAFHDLEGQVTFQTKLLSKSKVENVYLKEGAFLAYDSDKKVALSGTVQDGVLTNAVISESYLSLIETNSKKHAAHTIVGVLLKSIVESIKNLQASNQKRLSPAVLLGLKTCHQNTLDTLTQMMNGIDANIAHEASREMAYETKAFIKVQKKLLEKDIVKLLGLMEGEMDGKNYREMHKLVKVFGNRYGYKSREIDNAWNDILFDDVPIGIYEYILKAREEAIAEIEQKFVCSE